MTNNPDQAQPVADCIDAGMVFIHAVSGERAAVPRRQALRLQPRAQPLRGRVHQQEDDPHSAAEPTHRSRDSEHRLVRKSRASDQSTPARLGDAHLRRAAIDRILHVYVEVRDFRRGPGREYAKARLYRRPAFDGQTVLAPWGMWSALLSPRCGYVCCYRGICWMQPEPRFGPSA